MTVIGKKHCALLIYNINNKNIIIKSLINLKKRRESREKKPIYRPKIFAIYRNFCIWSRSGYKSLILSLEYYGIFTHFSRLFLFVVFSRYSSLVLACFCFCFLFMLLFSGSIYYNALVPVIARLSTLIRHRFGHVSALFCFFYFYFIFKAWPPCS